MAAASVDPHVMAHYFVTEHIKNNAGCVSVKGNFPSVIDYTAQYVDPCTYTIHSWCDELQVLITKNRFYDALYMRKPRYYREKV